MHIKLIAVGKVKERYLRQAIDDYVRRLGFYAKVEIFEAKEESFKEPLSEGEIEQIKSREAAAITRFIAERDLVCALDMARGRLMTSEAFAGWLSDSATRGRSEISFLIGGALGLSEELVERADLVLSISQMTFPHQLVRLILCEQIYCAFTIFHGQKYHK